MIKPVKKWGRFYNHDGESVISRVKEVCTTFFRVATHNFNTDNINRINTSFAQATHHWMVNNPPVQRSETPRITWLGHATFLIQLAGLNIVTDPVFDHVFFAYPRLMPMPFALNQLPPIDIILISHNHIDHLDKKSLLSIRHQQPLVFVPQGDATLFKKYGFSRCKEKTWWQQERIDHGVTLHFLPAKHWSGTNPFNINCSLWGSWIIEAEDFSIYFGGDTAFGSHFKHINNYFGTVNVALLPIGPQEPRTTMKEVHMNGSDAVQACIDLESNLFIPMHWGTFKAGFDTFGLPLENLKTAWHATIDQKNHKNKQLHIMKFGESWCL